MEDRDLLIAILKKLLRAEEKSAPPRGEVGLSLDQVDVDSPHGVYRYSRENSKWVLISVDDEDFTQKLEPGNYVVYFDNAKCPACRVYDMYWYPFVKLLGDAYPFSYLVVLCNWFSKDCGSKAASKAFEKFDVHASPTTVIMTVENGGRIARSVKVEGVKRMDELAKIVEDYLKKAG
ncbi:hypothetical protein [Thermogladius sp.]|uniref:hypothetical protein n=1 Tax=Thermogladius sp. TaxID=2023064 RepID=UPI003D151755